MGGTWITQNKNRPGAYINFESVPKPLLTVGDRGVMTMPVAMDWGSQADIIELYSTDLTNGKSESKIGYNAFNDESLIFRTALNNCYKALIFRADIGGSKAVNADVGGVACAAKYTGTRGNDIGIAVIDKTGGLFEVVTYVDQVKKEAQRVTKPSELVNNDWIDFTPVTGDTFVAAAGEMLTGGANGTVSETSYSNYLTKIKDYNWQTMAVVNIDPLVAKPDVFTTFITNQRDLYGMKRQVVLYNYNTADYEGVISVNQGFITSSDTITTSLFTAYIAGLTAGTAINKSNTGKEINNAVSIINPIAVEDIDEALLSGKFILTARQDGSVCVEKDINALHTFTTTKNYEFSKNRIIRAMDEINNTIDLTWNKSYKGKINNNAQGRSLFKSDIIAYYKELERLNVLESFDETTDIVINEGTNPDAVVVDTYNNFVDSAEILYMTVYSK
jgi:hypothetical protein